MDLFFSRVHIRQLFLFRLKIFKCALDNIVYRFYNIKRGHIQESGLYLDDYLSFQGVHNYHFLRNIRNTLMSFSIRIHDRFFNLSYKFILYMAVCDFFFKLGERLLKFDLFYRSFFLSILIQYLRYNQYRNFRFYYYYWICCKIFFLCELL